MKKFSRSPTLTRQRIPVTFHNNITHDFGAYCKPAGRFASKKENFHTQGTSDTFE